MIKGKMSPKLKKKWVEALRSGKYQQGKESLYDSTTNKYCCLGVLGRCKKIPKHKLDGPSFLDEICKTNGLDNIVQYFLAVYNDGNEKADINPTAEQWDFQKIADWIEKNL